MDYNSIIKPEAIINQCDDMLVKLDQDNDSIETVLNSFNQFINDSEIQSEAFNALKQRISDYILILQSMQIANEMDMEDCRSLSKWMEAVDGDIIGSDVLDGQEASKQDMQDHEYLAEQYEKKSASDDIFMKVYYESEKYYYKKLVKNDEEIYNEWKAIEQNYDEIDQMSAYYFVRGNEIRSTIELALQKLKQLSIDNSQECMSDTYRNILSEIYIMYYNTFDEGYLSETDKHQIKSWLKTDYKLRELELEHAKEIIDNYFEKNELAKELIKSGMPGEAAIIIPQMSVEEFNEYQMIVALVNKISKWNGFVLGAIDAVPFATEAIDWCDRIAIEGVGKQIVEDATLSNTMENVKCQNPIAYGSGYAASVIAQINILRGLKGGEAVETSYGKSSEIIQCNTKDAAADELAKRIGGQSRSAFADDPIQREFDVISDQYIAQAKPPLKCVNKTVRTQMKATFEAAKKYGRKVYYQFEGIPSQEVLDKLYEYSERYGVEVIIDTEPLGVLN